MGCRAVWSPARTFTASCTQPVREVSYTVPSAPLGAAYGSGGRGERQRLWGELLELERHGAPPPPPPRVTRIAPLDQAITDDSPDATRLFEIEVDQSARIIFYHNGGRDL